MFIAIEGIDGTGKATQANLLLEHYRSKGQDVKYFDFPAYESFVGKEVGNLLNKKNATDNFNAESLPAKLMAMLFSLDRMQFSKEIHEAIKDDKVVISNRYSLSNAVFQSIRHGSSLNEWVFELEHQALGLPIPDKYIILLGDLETSKLLVEKKGVRNYTDSHDLYESNSDLLINAQQLYKEIATGTASKIIIECNEQGKLRSIESIHNEIIKKLTDDLHPTFDNQDKSIFRQMSTNAWPKSRSPEELINNISHCLINADQHALNATSAICHFAQQKKYFKTLIQSAKSEKEIKIKIIASCSISSELIPDQDFLPIQIRQKNIKKACEILNCTEEELQEISEFWFSFLYK